MTPQIKQRIEQIRRGEVPEGYKKTKTGIVPIEWKEQRLSHYLIVNNDKNADLKYTKDDVFSISGELGIVNQIELLGRSYAGASVAPYGIVYPNDVVYTKSPLKSNPYGIIKTNKLGVTGIVSTLYAIFHCNNNASPDYVQLYFESDHNLNNYLYPIVNIGAKHDMKISDEGALRGTVVFPPLPEQEKIAEILTTLDRVIELCEKKVEQLKKLKRVFLQKMFPKPGASVPEWRFPGFSGAWEMRRFGDFMAEFSNKTKKENEYPLLSSTNKGMELRNGRVSGESNIGYKIIEDEDLVLSPQNLWLGNINVNRIGKGIVSPSYKTFKITGVFTSFVEAQLKRKHFLEVYKNASTLGASVVRRNLDMDLFFEIEMLFPSPIEQKKVGDFFAEINNLITLHQCKCDEEKQKKKALMQLLLTGIVRVRI